MDGEKMTLSSRGMSVKVVRQCVIAMLRKK